MHSRLTLFGFLALLVFVVGCRSEQPARLPTVAGVAPTVTPLSQAAATASPPRTPTLAPTAMPTPTVGTTATPTATATSPPPIRVAVPSFWRLEATAAAEAVSDARLWEIVVADDPLQEMNMGTVDAALVADDAGIAVGQRPLALAVPFSHEWVALSLQEAMAIVQQGHGFVDVVPWDELTPAQRPLRVDGLHVADHGYPLQQPWSLHATAELHEDAQAFAAALQQSPAPADVNIAAVGDIMLDRALGQAIAGGDISFPFVHVASFLQDADYTVGNLESALGDTGEPVAKSYTFRAPPQAVESLAWVGFDLVSLANNHALDYGPEALMQGLSLLQANSIAAVGAGINEADARKAHIVMINGLRFAFLAYVNVPVEGRAPYFDTESWTAGLEQPGLAWARTEWIVEDVRAVVDSVDEVIVILHSGYEYVPGPAPEQAAAARAAVDAGASLVIGHHAHILQGVAFHENDVIVYGLGNFSFNISGDPATAILNVWFDENGVRQIAFQPAVVQGSGQPAPVTGAEAEGIRRQIFNLSRNLN